MAIQINVVTDSCSVTKTEGGSMLQTDRQTVTQRSKTSRSFELIRVSICFKVCFELFGSGAILVFVPVDIEWSCLSSGRRFIYGDKPIPWHSSTRGRIKHASVDASLEESLTNTVPDESRHTTLLNQWC